MQSAVSLLSETPVDRGSHLAQPAGRPQATTRPSGGVAMRNDCQTLTRALDLMFALTEGGPQTLAQLQSRFGLTKSTTYRLASALVARRYLVCADRHYALGPKLMELAAVTPDQPV